jgi:hypothetical protein
MTSAETPPAFLLPRLQNCLIGAGCPPPIEQSVEVPESAIRSGEWAREVGLAGDLV